MPIDSPLSLVRNNWHQEYLMNLSRLAILPLGLLLLAEPNAQAAEYKIVVKALEDGTLVKDAEFRVRTATGRSLLKNRPEFDPKTKAYTLEVEEPKLDPGETLRVQLVVQARGRVRQ